MGRKPRVEFYGALYHVIQRGNNREYIFKRNEYKKYFLSKLKEFKDIMNFEVYGYVIMDNHYHLVIRCREVNMSVIMHRVNNDFSKYYNISNKRIGHVFQERYKGFLVKDDKYLLSLLKYVHQNPVKANMCKKVSDYYWSSDSSYRKNLQGKLVDIDFVLNIFSLNRKTAIEEYMKFMDSSELEESSKFEGINIIDENINSTEQIKIDRQSLDDILYDVVNKNEELFHDIKNGYRKRNLVEYKKMYTMKSLSNDYTMKEIGKNIGISESAISLLAKKIKEFMMASIVKSCAISGVDGYVVDVETKTIVGQPMTSIVGLGDAAVKEARERVESAIVDAHFVFPEMKIVINLAPSDLKKSGSHFDLPIAIGLLIEDGQIRIKRNEEFAFFGELSLNAMIRGCNGILPMVIAAKNSGIKNIVVPKANIKEASIVKDLNIYGFNSLREVVEFLEKKREYAQTIDDILEEETENQIDMDFIDVQGQDALIEFIVVAAAGGHNMIMIGDINKLYRMLIF